jgi:hypothetical protein
MDRSRMIEPFVKMKFALLDIGKPFAFEERQQQAKQASGKRDEEHCQPGHHDDWIFS